MAFDRKGTLICTSEAASPPAEAASEDLAAGAPA